MSIHRYPTAATLPKRLRRALSRLRKKVPLAFPIRVRIVEIPDKDDAVGIIDWVSNRFEIVLDWSLDDRSLVECLAHEWAHAVTWDVPERRHHPEIWGCAYARCYCAAFETT